ncbi:hypothetical protein HK099_005633 [Clydaea vesicula]|uniref:Uncharacterized protein n=1 Tax=Clydaea vesicula TaxID=447962 RepID=A0AAD5TZ03_9FUNG|nr:hypothetical protein HK099_005633 [Clydaea vesicula]
MSSSFVEDHEKKKKLNNLKNLANYMEKKFFPDNTIDKEPLVTLLEENVHVSSTSSAEKLQQNHRTLTTSPLFDNGFPSYVEESFLVKNENDLKFSFEDSDSVVNWYQEMEEQIFKKNEFENLSSSEHKINNGNHSIIDNDAYWIDRFIAAEENWKENGILSGQNSSVDTANFEIDYSLLLDPPREADDHFRLLFNDFPSKVENDKKPLIDELKEDNLLVFFKNHGDENVVNHRNRAQVFRIIEPSDLGQNQKFSIYWDGESRKYYKLECSCNILIYRTKFGRYKLDLRYYRGLERETRFGDEILNVFLNEIDVEYNYKIRNAINYVKLSRKVRDSDTANCSKKRKNNLADSEIDKKKFFLLILQFPIRLTEDMFQERLKKAQMIEEKYYNERKDIDVQYLEKRNIEYVPLTLEEQTIKFDHYIF